MPNPRQLTFATMTESTQEPLIRNYFGTFMTAFALIVPLIGFIYSEDDIELDELWGYIGNLNFKGMLIWILKSYFFIFCAVVILSVSLFVPKIFTLESKARALVFLPLLLSTVITLSGFLMDFNGGLVKILKRDQSIVSISRQLEFMPAMLALFLIPTLSLLSEASTPAALVFQPFMKPIKGIKAHWLGSLLSMLLVYLPAMLTFDALLKFHWYSGGEDYEGNINFMSVSTSAAAFLSVIAALVFFFWRSASPTQSANDRPVYSGLLLFAYPIFFYLASVSIASKFKLGLLIFEFFILALSTLAYVSLVVNPQSCFGKAYRPFIVDDQSVEQAPDSANKC